MSRIPFTQLALSTTLNALTHFSVIATMPSYSVTTAAAAGLLLSLYHLPAPFLHLHLLQASPHTLASPAAAAALAAALFLLAGLTRSLYPLIAALPLLGASHAATQTISATATYTHDPVTHAARLSALDLVATAAAAAAPLLSRRAVAIQLFLFVAHTANALHAILTRPPSFETDPLQPKPRLHIRPALVPSAVPSLIAMLVAAASLAILRPGLGASVPSHRFALSVLAASALIEPLAARAAAFVGLRAFVVITLAGIAAGTSLVHTGVLSAAALVVGACASSAAVVAVADLASCVDLDTDSHDPYVDPNFSTMRNPVALVAGIVFPAGEMLGVLVGAGGFPILHLWERVLWVVVVVVALPSVIAACMRCLRPFGILFAREPEDRGMSIEVAEIEG